MNGLQRLFRIWWAIENGALVLCLGVMIVLAFTQIILRNLAGTGIYWADGLLRYSVLWIGIVGAMIATRDRNHISIDLVAYFSKGPIKLGAGCLTQAISALLCGVLFWASIGFIAEEKTAGLMAFGTVPAWLAEMVLPVGFGVMTLRFLFFCLSDFQSLAAEHRGPVSNIP